MHEKVHGAFVDSMVKRTKALARGSGLKNVEIGPLVSEAAGKGDDPWSTRR